MKNPVLFIHGFGGGAFEYEPIIRFLSERGTFKSYQFSYQENLGQVSLRILARQLHEFICSNVSENEIDIIALSQGGIIARLYIAQYDDIRVRKCITLCTPHHGSLLAYFGILPGIKELQPSSILLKELDCTKARYFAVYNPFDLMVVPGWSGYLEEAEENKRVWALFHPLTFFHPKTLRFIERVLGD
ncbi:MAG: hypothetical protein Q8P56_02875 [Candidatus Uhrbacteria bacterium]|nr:hypothetical protein [Candidatus Uhrbacteria bacterium]